MDFKVYGVFRGGLDGRRVGSIMRLTDALAYAARATARTGIKHIVCRREIHWLEVK